MGPLSTAVVLFLVAAAPAAPPPAAAARADRGLATPTEEAWGDEWFDEEAERAGALERQRVIETEAERLAREREERAAREALAREAEAAPKGPKAPPILLPAATFADLEEAWTARRTALLRQDRQGAAEAEARLLALRDELDVPELHPYAAAAVRESRAEEELSAEEAVARADLAVVLGPSLPGAHFQLARARFLAAPGAIRAWFAPIAAGVRAVAAEPRWYRPIVADLGGSLCAGILLAGGAVLLLLAFRHGRLFLHDFHHLFPRAAVRGQTAALGALLLAVPALVGLGPLAAATAIALALVVYLGRAERAVVAAWLLALGLSPLLAGPLGNLVAWSEADQDLWSLERAGDFSVLPAVERRAALPGARPEELFAVARAKKRTGDLDGAAGLYERALAARPDWPQALVNLGNVRFLQGREADALSLYTRAIQRRPGLAAAYFDLSRLHYRRLDFDPGQAARKRALDLDRSLLDRYAEGEREGEGLRANRFLLDLPLASDHLAGALHPDDEALLAAEAARAVLGPVPAPYAPWAVAVVLAAFLGLGALAPKLRRARTCEKCGRSACRRCDPEVGEGGLCGQCVHVYARKEAVDPAARLQKELAVRRYQERRRRWSGALAFVLSAQVDGGRVVRGALLLAVALALAAIVVVPGGPIPPAAGGPPVILRLALAWPLLLAVWIVGVRDGLGREG